MENANKTSERTDRNPLVVPTVNTKASGVSKQIASPSLSSKTRTCRCPSAFRPIRILAGPSKYVHMCLDLISMKEISNVYEFFWRPDDLLQSFPDVDLHTSGVKQNS